MLISVYRLYPLAPPNESTETEALYQMLCSVYRLPIPRQQLFSLIDSWPGSNQGYEYKHTAFFKNRSCFDLLSFVLMKHMYIHQVTIFD